MIVTTVKQLKKIYVEVQEMIYWNEMTPEAGLDYIRWHQEQVAMERLLDLKDLFSNYEPNPVSIAGLC